jgi:F-type H+-transporting ATPase subunit a
LPPGVPLGIQQLLTVIEIASNLLIKPVALAIRLFANIAAGHFMVLSLICLIFIFGKAGQSVGGAIGGVVMGIPFAIGIMILETLVAIVQAYIFTLLTTVFLGQAMESHDHHEEGHAHH